MSDIYKVAIALSMTSNAPAFLSALGSKLLHVHTQVKDLEGGLNRLNRIKLAVGGGLAIAGGAAGLSMLGKMVDKGNELVKVQQNMAAAGVKAAEVQEAYAKSWELTRKYANVGAAEIMQTINEARMTFGSQHEATNHVEDFVKMISFLKAFQGGKHGAGAGSFVGEANAAMKSGELAGKISPQDMAEHVKQLTAMRVAYGEQVKISQYLTAQRAGGVALRNTDDKFRYGIFPALVQENGPGAGVMLMTAFNKIVAGTGIKTDSARAMMDMGLLDPSKVSYDKTGRVSKVGLGGIQGSSLFAKNPQEWVDTILKPLIEKKTQDPTEQAKWLSKMFPDRNAAKALLEMLQQGPKFHKDAGLMLEARKAQDEGTGYLDKSWEGQKQAFHDQFENFVQALGAPMVGQATETLKRINVALADMGQWASRPEMAATVEQIGKGLAVLSVSLTAGGAAALLAAIGPAGWLAAGLSALVAIDLKGAQQQFDMARRDFEMLTDFAKWAGGKVDAIMKALDPITSMFAGKGGEKGEGDPMGRFVTGYINAFKSLHTALADAGLALATEIKSWPSKLATAITEMGAGLVTAIGDMLKGLFGKDGLFGKLRSIMGISFEGGGFGAGLQNASFSTGGGANDNFGGSVGRALGRGAGGAGGSIVPRGGSTVGTGAGGSWYESIMRAEGTAGKDPYNVVLGNGRYGLPSKPLTDMSLAEAYQFGRSVRARHGSSSAIGAFQIVGQTMKTFMGEAGLGWQDKFSPENQRKLAAVIRKRQGIGAWEGFKSHPGERENARSGPEMTAPPPTAGPPPRRQDQPGITYVHLDGKVIATAVTARQVRLAQFPTKGGGMDTHGGWRDPGTPLIDAA